MQPLATTGPSGHHDSKPRTDGASVVRRARAYTRPTTHQHARGRLLALLGEDLGTYSRSDQRPRPWSWWQVRHRLGGVVDTEAFRAIVQELLAEGLLVDVVEETGDRRMPRHLLVLVARWTLYDWASARIIAVEGREDVLRRLGVDTLGA